MAFHPTGSRSPKPVRSSAVTPIWHGLCQKNKDGRLINNLFNAIVALQNDPHFDGLLGYDELERTPVLLQPSVKAVQDADVTVLQRYLQEATLRHMAKDTVNQAIDYVSREHPFHPVRNYLDGLTWDGQNRLDLWLSDYLGVARLNDMAAIGADYVDQVGRMFMISAIARIYQPGCQCDYVLVLEGNQGNLKSSAVGVLGGAWFSDHLPDLHKNPKDVSQHLNGVWIVEIAELSALVKADATAIKTFITRRTERYRRSYGRRDVVEPRQCVLIGTTNEATYLRDPTGGRRFWPVLVTRVDLDRLKSDRDQLWAEAVHRYRAGVSWWPDANFEFAVIKPQQEQRFEEDAWVHPIRGYLAGTHERGNALDYLRAPKDRVTVLQVAQEGLGFLVDRLKNPDQKRITAILRSLQWKEARDNQGRWWEPVQ